MLTRREFGALTLSSLAMPALARAQIVGGVQLGVQTYSFRALPRAPGRDLVDPIIAAMKACGLTECELWSPQIEPVSALGRGASPGKRGTRERRSASGGSRRRSIISAASVVRAWRRVDRLEAAQQVRAQHLHRHLETWVDDDGMLVLLCRRHHRFVHSEGWTIAHGADDAKEGVRFIRPEGIGSIRGVPG
jgi:hypothetical protein